MALQTQSTYNNGMPLPPPTKVDFAALCKKLRKDYGWTQEQMANELGVHIVTYKRWEGGSREPSAQVAFRLCQMWNALDKKENQ